MHARIDSQNKIIHSRETNDRYNTIQKVMQLTSQHNKEIRRGLSSSSLLLLIIISSSSLLLLIIISSSSLLLLLGLLRLSLIRNGLVVTPSEEQKSSDNKYGGDSSALPDKEDEDLYMTTDSNFIEDTMLEHTDSF